ncbi:MAG TPA: hypothetical protein VLO30_06895 [Chthoniobacterales bacterium]|nr:hypothetical protein [Chthoniobacterales bacterium]
MIDQHVSGTGLTGRGEKQQQQEKHEYSHDAAEVIMSTRISTSGTPDGI